MNGVMRALTVLAVTSTLAGCGGDDSGGDGSGGASGSGGSGTGGTGGNTKYPPQPGGYHVVGNQILDASGQVHHFHGVSRPSMEWNRRGESIAEYDFQLIKSWGANVVRLPLDQAYWLNDPDYKEYVRTYVDIIHDYGMDVILDLHHSQGSNLQATEGEQQRMADANSIVFWSEVAAAYKDDPHAVFELYNEPHDVSWDVWLNGGSAGGFEVAGMKQLYDAVRATGAENLVIVGGLDFAYDLKGLPQYAIPDGVNVAYASHPYDFNTKMPGSWDQDWGFLAATHPIVVTEFGRHPRSPVACDPAYPQQLIDYANAKGIGWIAWAWYTGGCTFPSLIEDYDGTPTDTGAMVKTELQALEAQ